MKKVLIYIAGVVTGVILTILISLLLVKSSDNGVTIFDKPGDYVKGNQFEVFQVIESGAALANTEEILSHRTSIFTGPVVLFVNDEGKHYYDDEVIKIPSGKHARQIGIYKYSTKIGYKTVPIVKIME